MSYIVAFMRFDGKDELYPVNCWRSDAKEGDFALVRINTRNGILRRAEIAHLSFYNWKCANSIECLADEAEFTPQGIILPQPSRMHQGINRPVDVWNLLKPGGWRLHRSNGTTYKFACSLVRHGRYCTIRFRKNGIDLQIVDASVYDNPMNEFPRFLAGQGHIERITTTKSDINAFVYIHDLASRFEKNVDHRDLVKPGACKRRIPWAAPADDGDTNWKSAFDRRDGPVYLHDGQYL